MTSDAIRVALDARGSRGLHGGVETVVLGLCYGLAELQGDEEYFLLTDRGLEPLPVPYDYEVTAAIALSGGGRLRSRLARRMPRTAGVVKRLLGGPGEPAESIPVSDGTIESAGIDVIHFPTQSAFLTEIPSLYHPHDLQHLHHPERFDEVTLAKRAREYPAFVGQAAYVPVASSWVARDVRSAFALSEEKVPVVPWAAIQPAFSSAGDADGPLTAALPPAFVLYPAQTWPHKNHAHLIEAVARLRAAGEDVPLVVAGRRTEHAVSLDRLAARRGVRDLVTWTGFVDDATLTKLYSLATIVAIPTGYEAASLPMWEAFHAGVPVVASDVTSLPRQANGAAVIVPVGDVGAFADAIGRLWRDPAARDELRRKGLERDQDFTWERTARAFRALYRAAAGRELSTEDNAALATVSRI